MRYLIFCLFILFCTQLQAKDKAVIGGILVEEGDIVIYPPNTEPVEVEASIAKKNHLTYICTVMPEDTFSISYIFNYDDGTTKVAIKKTGGMSGDQKVCHKDSYIHDVILQTPKTIKTKEEGIHEFYSPFTVDSETVKDIQRRKDKDKISTSNPVFFKRGNRVIYPLDAEPAKIETNLDNIPCTIAPGDTFETKLVINYIHGSSILLTKVNGTPGDQEICHSDRDSVTIQIPKCELVKTKEGIPEGVNCEVSPQKLFDYLHVYEPGFMIEAISWAVSTILGD